VTSRDVTADPEIMRMTIDPPHIQGLASREFAPSPFGQWNQGFDKLP